jgi:hypothetical protein
VAFGQGNPLSPYLFLLVVEALGCAIHEANRCRRLQGIQIGRGISITRLLFVNDVLLFCFGYLLEGLHLKDLLVLFCTTTRMEINHNKSTSLSIGLDDAISARMDMIFNFQHLEFNNGFKYLGFNLKPNNCGKEDSRWLLSRVEQKIASSAIGGY